jgi:flagellar protein FliS
MMNVAYAQNAYTNTKAITSTTPLDLVIMLYDGAIEYLHKTIFYINQGNTERKIYYITKTMAIVEELLSSLNMEEGREIAQGLRDLYIYMLRELTAANARNDIEKIRHLEGLLKELLSAWKQIR